MSGGPPLTENGPIEQQVVPKVDVSTIGPSQIVPLQGENVVGVASKPESDKSLAKNVQGTV